MYQCDGIAVIALPTVYLHTERASQMIDDILICHNAGQSTRANLLLGRRGAGHVGTSGNCDGCHIVVVRVYHVNQERTRDG